MDRRLDTGCADCFAELPFFIIYVLTSVLWLRVLGLALLSAFAIVKFELLNSSRESSQIQE